MPRLFERTCKGFLEESSTTTLVDACEDFWTPYNIQMGEEDFVTLPINLFFGSARYSEREVASNEEEASLSLGEASETGNGAFPVEQTLMSGSDTEESTMPAMGLDEATFFPHSYDDIFAQELTTHWDRKFFLDYILIKGKTFRMDYLSVLPASSTLQFEYTMKPHTVEKPGPIFSSELEPKKDLFFLHDGITNLQENVWWVIVKGKTNQTEKPKREYFPEDMITLFNAAKIRAFDLLRERDNTMHHRIWSLNNGEDVATNFFSRDVKFGCEELRAFGKKFQEVMDRPRVLNADFFLNADLFIILERHGQNKEIKVLEPQGLDNFCEDFASKVHWGSVQEFEIAWTWELYPLVALTKGSFFLSKEGIKKIMPNPDFYPRCGLQDVCNAQSQLGFKKLELERNIDGVTCVAANTQIYSATRHFLRPTAREEPFQNGIYTKTLSAIEVDVIPPRISAHEDLKKARDIIDSLENVQKGMRLEQEICYKVTEGATPNFYSFFLSHLKDLLKNFGLSTRRLTSREMIAKLRDQVSSTSMDCKQELMDKLEVLVASETAEICIFTLNGISMTELGPFITQHHVWPGMLKGYLKMFESTINRFTGFLQKERSKFIPTSSLEVLGMQERILSYLFSGDLRKLGQRRIYDLGLRDWLLNSNFPCLLGDLFLKPTGSDGLPLINLKKFPKNGDMWKLNIFSQRKDPNSFKREAVFPLELLLDAVETFTDSALAEVLLKCLYNDLGARYKTHLDEEDIPSNRFFTENRLKDRLLDCSLIKMSGVVDGRIWSRRFFEMIFEKDKVFTKCESLKAAHHLLKLKRTQVYSTLQKERVIDELETSLNFQGRLCWLPLLQEASLKISTFSLHCYSQNSNVADIGNSEEQLSLGAFGGIDLRLSGLEKLFDNVYNWSIQWVDGTIKDYDTLAKPLFNRIASNDYYQRCLILRLLFSSTLLWIKKGGKKRGYDIKYLLSCSLLLSFLVEKKESLWYKPDYKGLLGQYRDKKQPDGNRFRTTGINSKYLVETGLFVGSGQSRGFSLDSLRVKKNDYNLTWNEIMSSWTQLRDLDGDLGIFLRSMYPGVDPTQYSEVQEDILSCIQNLIY